MLVSLAIIEMHIKITVQNHCTSIIAKLKLVTRSNAGKEAEKLDEPNITGGNVKWHNRRKQLRNVLQK